MILDLGAPCSLVGKDWLDKYVEENGMKKENMKTIECNKKFSAPFPMAPFRRSPSGGVALPRGPIISHNTALGHLLRVWRDS